MIKFIKSFFSILLCMFKDQTGALTAELNSLGNDLFMEVTDGVFTGNVALKRLREKQQVVNGGLQIRALVNSVDDTSTTGGFYSPRDTLDMNEYEAISYASFDWKYFEEHLVLYNADIAKNQSPQGIADLMTERAKIKQMAIAQKLAKAYFSDGTASTGNQSAQQWTGIQAAIDSDTSSVYGNIDPSDLASWISYESSSIGTLALADLNDLFDEATEPGKFGPSVAYYDKDVFTAHKGLLSTYQRAAAESSLDGFGHGKMALIYNGIPHLVDNQSPSGEVYYIDEEHLKLVVQKDNNMRLENFDKLETLDAIMRRCFLYANICTKQRIPHAVGSGITG